jgi:hypothetical protein
MEGLDALNSSFYDNACRIFGVCRRGAALRAADCETAGGG